MLHCFIFCSIMEVKKENCCFCFNFVLEGEGSVVNSNILALLKFLVVNVDTNVLENSTVCNSCLNSILETCEYKRRNSLKNAKSKNPTMCQKCKKLCEQGDSFLLMDCVTQIEWSDFVNYLFEGQDLESLESSQICSSCWITVSNIQDFLKLICKYDQSKMKCEINNCYEIKTTELENLMNNEEFETFSMNDKTVIDENDYISHAHFKCKSEVEVKLEDDDQNEQVDAGTEMIPSGSSNMINPSSGGCSVRLRHSNNRSFKCIYCSKGFSRKIYLNNHLLRFHNCRDEVTSKIHECDKCSYVTTHNAQFVRHKLKHGVNEGLKKYECQHCNYKTYHRNYFVKHMKLHNNIQDFKCTFCSKEFSQIKFLNEHFIKVHNSKESVTCKIHECDKCSYETTMMNKWLRHKVKHGIQVELKKYKCHSCVYETYDKSNLNNHIKTHNNFRGFKCTFCSKEFTKKIYLDEHFVRDHNSKESVTCKIHECDKCTYETTVMNKLLIHKLKHGIQVELEKYKCHNCVYETHSKSNLVQHVKIHRNFRDFKCTLCSKEFFHKIHLDYHLVTTHKSKDSVTSKLYQCDTCNYASILKDRLLRHKLTHGTKIDLEKYKCQHCTYETYNKYHLIRHVKIHNNFRDFFKCTSCSKEFIERRHLDDHLLKVHKHKNSVISKIHECDKCSYKTTIKNQFLKHKLKHDVKQ